MKSLSESLAKFVKPTSVAAEWVQQAKHILVTAGAGMGVDSGLPDFRGPEGFWRAYPLFKKLGKRFEEMSNPEWFDRDPEIAWGFFGHRLQLYAATEPHLGYRILRQWETDYGKNIFVFTSNVDGAFQKAGFPADRLVECHGSGTRLQCTNENCVRRFGPYPTPKDFRVDVDMKEVRADPKTMPLCPNCGALARPNVLMFGDWGCDFRVIEAQHERYEKYLEEHFKSAAGTGEILILEFGAGEYVPTIRHQSEYIARTYAARFIRVNPREPEVPRDLSKRSLELAMGAKDMLEMVHNHISKK